MARNQLIWSSIIFLSYGTRVYEQNMNEIIRTEILMIYAVRSGLVSFQGQ